MSRIYLVQSGQDLDGADGYSLGLLKGEQPWVLVSFVDFMESRQNLIIDPSNIALRRRTLVKRVLKRSPARRRRN